MDKTKLTKKRKSLPIALILTFFFGPIGLFYVSILGAFIMICIPILFALVIFYGNSQESDSIASSVLLFFIFFLSVYNLISMIWAYFGVKDFNSQIDKKIKLIEYLQNLELESNTNNVDNSTNSSNNMNFQNWISENPSKSINDYYRIHKGKYESN